MKQSHASIVKALLVLGPKGKNVYDFVIIRYDNGLYQATVMNEDNNEYYSVAMTKSGMEYRKWQDSTHILCYHEENITAERNELIFANQEVFLQFEK